MSESQASRLINSLVKIGLIQSILFNQKGRNNERRLYVTEPINQTFSDEVCESILSSGAMRKSIKTVSAEMPRGYPQKCVGGIRKNAEDNKPINKPMSKRVNTCVKDAKTPKVVAVKKAPKLEHDFELFWAVYPNHKPSKSKGLESFQRAIKSGVDIQTILLSVDNHKKTRSWQQGYIPHITTWLNRFSWEAEFTESDFIIQVDQDMQHKKDMQARLTDNSELDAMMEQTKFQDAKLVSGSLPLAIKSRS